MKPLLLLVVWALLLSPGRAQSSRANCKPVASGFCQGLGYTSTPNPTGVPGFYLQQIAQIVETSCSPKVAMLMCRVVVPECGHDESSSQMKPCKALCEKVKSDCDPVLRTRRLSWPSRIRCDALPASRCVQVGSRTDEGVHVIGDLPYTDTVLPNVLGHATQREAGAALLTYGPLIQVGCSAELKPFLCSVFTPKCVSGSPAPPCRALCEQARAGCESLMNKFGIQWPETLRCEAFTSESCENAHDFGLTQPSAASCQTISVPLCRDLPYTETVLPNVLGHATQEEAGTAAFQFASLVRLGCSTHLKPFVCSVYTPECVEGTPRPPCRTLCEHARSDCQSLMSKFGLRWPDSLKCDAFTTESCEHYGVGSGGGICEPITIPMCQGLSYNQTMSPNLLGHASQREAVAKMSFFNAMVQTMCTVDIRLFVCAVYVPPCLVGEVQRPCRSFCERARRGCGAFMASFDVSWPAELQCDSFPVDKCVSQDSRPDADKTGDLNVVEVFKLEHHVAVLRREYVESYEGRNPPSVTQTQMKKALSLHGKKSFSQELPPSALPGSPAEFAVRLPRRKLLLRAVHEISDNLKINTQERNEG
ncbi:Frizzled-1 [Liparis tanakae]|uniref:Frizzled-1 n=1 Tax=Liparis tanakae TaxID=230148 RepID=A0A4Z2GGK2_9TELE|nr:Frizzled-1 [Liparis tanakae]